MLASFTDTSGEKKTGILLCYDNPEFEEEEQEVPFLRWYRYLSHYPRERYIERMTFVIISEEAPRVFHGVLRGIKTTDGKAVISFFTPPDIIFPLALEDLLNDSIERQLTNQGLVSGVPVWNGREVVLKRMSVLDHEEEVSSKVFVEEWIGSLCISLYHVTKSFVDFISWRNDPVGISQDSAGTRKSPRSNQQLFWLWWPLTKPRDLSAFVSETIAKGKIYLRYLNQHGPLMSGIYRVAIRRSLQDGEQQWFMKMHWSRDAHIRIYFDAPEVPEPVEEYYPDFSKEVRIIFNHNFAWRHGMKPGVNVYGIFGSKAYVTAQLFPYTRDNLCPMLPCLSSISSLSAFKKSIENDTDLPDEIDGILSRARRLRSALGAVLKQVGNYDQDYFEK